MEITYKTLSNTRFFNLIFHHYTLTGNSSPSFAGVMLSKSGADWRGAFTPFA